MKRMSLTNALAVFLLIGLGMADRGWAQAPSSPRETVARAIEAVGGAEGLRRLERVILKGRADHWDPEQSLRPGGEARYAGSSTVTLSRDLAADSTRIDWERSFAYPSPRVFTFSEIYAGGIGYVQGVDSSGRTARSLKASPPGHTMSGHRLAAAHRELKRTSPKFLLEMIANGEKLAFPPGQPVDARFPVVQYRDAASTFTVMFEPKTYLPTRVRVLDVDHIQGDSTSDVVFSDWQEQGGVKIARQVVYQLNGREVARFRFSDVAVNPPLGADLFEIPAAVKGGASRAATGNVPYQWVLRRQAIGVYLDSDMVGYDPEASSGLRLVELGPDIQHVVGATHNSLIVEMPDHLIVIDAPIDEGQSTWTINAAKAKYPGKPIKYLVLTHHHMDHAGGARTYVAEGATVVVGSPNKAHFERVFTAPHTLDKDRLQQSPRKANILEVTDFPLSLMGGTRQVKLYLLPNQHAEGMLIAHVPDAGLGFVTDIWSPGRDTVGNPSQAALLAALRGWGFRPEVRFAGGHGTTATVADLQRQNAPR